jgi:hypothetical protein
VRPYLKFKKKKKKSSQGKADGVAQGAGPEFKFQYYKKKSVVQCMQKVETEDSTPRTAWANLVQDPI